VESGTGRAGRSAAWRVAAVAAALLCAGGGPSTPCAAQPAGWRDLPPFDRPGSLAPNLAPTRHGLLLTWLEPLAAPAVPGHALRLARLEAGRWSAPVTVASGDLFANWADFPALAEDRGGGLYAHWLAKTGPGKYAYSILVARSSDGGRTWRTLGPLHEDRTETEHGFVSFVREGDGVRAFWLDGRETARGGDMALRTALLQGDRIGASEVVDPRVCDCCQTAAARVVTGPVAAASVVAYRDRSAEEVRDISLSRAEAGRWTPPATAHRDGWKIPGCPVNGPVLAAGGVEPRLALAWFTAADQRPRVQVAFSGDAGRSFGAPVVVDGERPLGRVALVKVPGGDAIVAWLAVAGQEGEIRVRRVAPNGGAGPPLTISAASQARASGFPRLAVVGDELVVAWVAAGEPSRLRVGSVALAAIPAAR
jgi:hypothetical protein